MTLKRALFVFALLAGVAVAAFVGRRVVGVSGLRAGYLSTEPPRTIDAPHDDVSLDVARRRFGGQLPQAFRANWFGYLTVFDADDYTFALTSDDGSYLWVDGRLIVDNNGRHAAITKSATMRLERGQHAVLVEYEQAGGDAVLTWWWGRNGERVQPVPSWLLFPGRRSAAAVLSSRGLDLLFVGTISLAAIWAFVMAIAFGRTPARRAIASDPRVAALLLFAALTMLETWPLAADPAHLSRNDNGDAMLNEWVIAWVAHAAIHAPSRIFDGNDFYPERYTLAYAETMVVQSAMAAPILWLGGSPVLAYNLVLLAGFTLTGWAMYVLIVSWTESHSAGLVAGVLFAFNAHNLTRLPHLQTQHVEFLPFALLALDRLIREPGARNAGRLALWFVLQSLTSIYLLVLTLAALVGAVLVRPDAWRNAKVVRWGAMAAVAGSIVLLPFLVPYWRLYHDQGLTRSIEEITRLSASWSDYLSTPARVHYGWWSQRWFGGAALFPGALALVLAAAAVIGGDGLRDRRARMCAAIGVVGVALSFGTKLPGYEVAYRVLLPLHAVRAVGRFGYLAVFAVAALAGFGAAWFLRRRSPLRQTVIGLVLIALAVVDTFAGPLELTRFDGIPRIYDRLRGGSAIVVELPFYGPSAGFAQARYLLNSTRHWQPMLNGYSGFYPAGFRRNVEVLAAFPDGASIGALRTQGVTHVFVHTDEMPAEALARLEGTRDLQQIAREGAIVLYRVR